MSRQAMLYRRRRPMIEFRMVRSMFSFFLQADFDERERAIRFSRPGVCQPSDGATIITTGAITP